MTQIRILSRIGKVTTELMKECSEEMGLKLDMDRTIGELKEEGVISSSLRGLSRHGIPHDKNLSFFEG